MNAAEQLFGILAAKSAELGRKLHRTEWIGTAQPFLDSLKPKAKPRKKNILGAGLTDDQWFAELAKDPDYAGIDLPNEGRKCRLYFKSGPKPSRMRMLKWFAKADRTLPTNGAKVGAGAVGPIPPPEDWSGLIRDDPDDGQFAGACWETMHPFYQRRIAKKIEAMKREERTAK